MVAGAGSARPLRLAATRSTLPGVDDDGVTAIRVLLHERVVVLQRYRSRARSTGGSPPDHIALIGQRLDPFRGVGILLTDATGLLRYGGLRLESQRFGVIPEPFR